MATARAWPVARAAAACGLREEQIVEFAQWLAEADPLVFAPGNGLERGRNGGSSIRALIALPALLGKLGKGSGIVLGASNAFPKTPARLQRPDLAPPGMRTLNLLDVGRHLAEDDIDPPLRAVFIYNHNPIVVHPDQNRMRRGLARDDVFAVGIDVAMTESMAYCDIVLPAATHFEYADLYPSYGHHWLQRAEAVIPPVGESLPNTEIFRRLAARFGFDDPCFKASDEELMDAAVDLGDVRPSEISTENALQMKGKDGKPLVLFENVFPATPSGRIELRSEALAQRWGEAALMPAWRERPGGLSADADLAGVGPADHLDARVRRIAAAADDASARCRDARTGAGQRGEGVERARRGDPAARRDRRRAAAAWWRARRVRGWPPAAPGRRFRRWCPPTCAPISRKVRASTIRWWR